MLLARIGAGDLTAFDELYAAHRDWVHRLAWRFSGDAEDALDVLQETFAYLVGKLPTLSLRGRLTSFLYPVVKHLSAAARRKRQRHAGSEHALDDLLAQGQGESGETVAARQRRELLELVRALPEPQREVVLLRYADGLEQAEIATLLAIPVGTVKSRLHHAQRALRADPRLRAVLEQGGPPPAEKT